MVTRNDVVSPQSDTSVANASPPCIAPSAEVTGLRPPEATLLTRETIEELAEKVNKKLIEKLNVTPTTPLEDVVKMLGGVVKTRPHGDDIASDGGMIEVNGPRDFVIWVSERSDWIRRRRAIAHELAHYFLHAPGNKYSLRAEEGRYPLQNEIAPVEVEADWFAMTLLMPEEQFKNIFKEKQKSIVDVSLYFGVSIAAAEERARELGLG